jgi:ribosomal protein S16
MVMPAIVRFPEVVEQALATFAPVFQNKPQMQHFGEYLTGLYIAQRKTVNGIHAEFVDITDQSCLNRWLSEAPWDPTALNEARLAELQKRHDTRYSKYGVIAIDDTLIDRDGKLIEDVGYFWDHAEQRSKLAHDLLIANYVATSGKHYPLEFRRFRKEEQCRENGEEFKNHTVLFLELVDFCISRHIPGTFVFDSYFTNAEALNPLHARKRDYVGDLKFNRKVVWNGREMSADEMAASIPFEDRKLVETADGKEQWYFSRSIRIPKLDHKVKVVILWKGQREATASKILITNQLNWEVKRIVGAYRRRWTGTETFHRDGKQLLGLGDCQLRSGEGQTRHTYLVFMAYSLLLPQMQGSRVQEWSTALVSTIGDACRAVLRDTLGKTIRWAVGKAQEHAWSSDKICKHLALG